MESERRSSDKEFSEPNFSLFKTPNNEPQTREIDSKSIQWDAATLKRKGKDVETEDAVNTRHMILLTNSKILSVK